MSGPAVVPWASLADPPIMSPVATATAPALSNGKELIREQEDEANALRSRSNKSRTPFPKAPTFTDKLEEREYLKFKLAQAFRIFGHLGYDEGVAGHITVRVCGSMRRYPMHTRILY